MCFNKGARDRQADATPTTCLARARFINTIEAIEDVGKMFGWNSNPSITNRNLDFVIRVLRGNHDSPPFRSILQCIPREICKYLHGAVFIGEDPWKIRSQFEVQGDA